MVIQSIHDRQGRGLALNAHAVEIDDSRLIAAARRLFGGWDNALRATNIDPHSVRPKSARRPSGSWSRPAIVAEILRYAECSERLDAHHMHLVDNPLVSAATYYFGSWSSALKASGIDPLTVRQNTVRNPRQILDAIRGMAESSQTLRDYAVRTRDRALYGAAQKYFGSWRNAVREAGYEEAARSSNSRWSRTDIQALVIRYTQCGVSLQEALTRHTHLKSAILREWGSWDAFEQEYRETSIARG